MAKTKAELQAENFNLKNPVGSEVVVTLDDKSKFKTTTNYKAYVMCGVAVVGIEGISGCYSLDRVKGV